MARLKHSLEGERWQRGNRNADGSPWRWLTGAIIGLVMGIPWSAASAAVFTVGDHGTYSRIDAAIDAALGTGLPEIRVEQGTYVENIFIGTSFVSDDLGITGGWNATFSARSSDASLTVIDGGQWMTPWSSSWPTEGRCWSTGSPSPTAPRSSARGSRRGRPATPR